MKKDLDFAELLNENGVREQDEFFEDEECDINDGLDPGFSSWADYYHFMYG